MRRRPRIIVKRKLHCGCVCLFLFFDPNEELSSTAKALFASWSKSFSAWFIFEDSFSVHYLFSYFLESAIIDVSGLETVRPVSLNHPIPPMVNQRTSIPKDDLRDIKLEKLHAIEHFGKYMKTQGYRSWTIRDYKYRLRQFLNSTKCRIDKITAQHIIAFREFLIERRRETATSISHFMTVLRIFFWLREKKIFFVDKREYNTKEWKHIRIISHKVLNAIWSYSVEVGSN